MAAWVKIFTRQVISRLILDGRSVRQFRNSLRRTPLAVLSEDEAKNRNGYVSPFKSVHPPINTETRNKNDEVGKAKKVVLPSKTVKIQPQHEDVPDYEILEEDDKKFVQTMMLVKSRKEREKTGKILLEGKRLIKDAIDAGVKLESVYFSRENSLIGMGLNALQDINVYKVKYSNIKTWSSLTTSPGVMAVCKKLAVTKLASSDGLQIPVTVICDNVREPGNLGSILRNAAASGCEKAIMTTGCVDVWEPKVLRGGCGAHFHLPIYNNISWSLIQNYLPESFTLILADNDMKQHSEPGKSKKQKRDKESSVQEEEYIVKLPDGRLCQLGYENENILNEYLSVPLPSLDYSAVNYIECDKIVLVVGGETEGLSAAALKLAHSFKGLKAVIPMANNMESLNSAAAVAVLLYEIRRQLKK